MHFESETESFTFKKSNCLRLLQLIINAIYRRPKVKIFLRRSLMNCNNSRFVVPIITE